MISTKNLLRNRVQFLPSTFTLGRRLPQTTRRQTRTLTMGVKTNITLYTAATPNGIKIPILLEELRLEYKVRMYATVKVTGL